jgi:hypothetical protein
VLAVCVSKEREEEENMKKLALMILTISSAISLTLVSSSYAAEFLGYTMVPKQANFYSIILGLIGASVGLVSALYTALWLSDLRKKEKAKAFKPALARDEEAFDGEMVAVAQPAK